MTDVFGYDHRTVVADVVAISAIALLLVGIHYLIPAALRESVVFSYATPNPFHAVTTAYVHVDSNHLFSNVVGYLIATPVCYLLCLIAGERRWFRFTGLALLTILPIAVSMTSGTIIGGRILSRGFSGIVAGFGGFILVTTPVLLRNIFDCSRQTATAALAFTIFAIAAELVWLLKGSLPPYFLGVTSIGAGLSIGGWIHAYLTRADPPPIRENWVRSVLGGAVVLLNLAIVSWFVVGLFPPVFAADGHVTNILSHFLGFVYGAIIAGWGHRYWSTL